VFKTPTDAVQFVIHFHHGVNVLKSVGVNVLKSVALSFLFSSLQSSHGGVNTNAPRSGPKMEGTAWGWHKCDVDGAFFASCNSGSTGVILQDHDGYFMAGRET
jgi:hypothetical protein